MVIIYYLLSLVHDHLRMQSHKIGSKDELRVKGEDEVVGWGLRS